ncbi:MAG: TIGR00341 family protein [Anaerolineae bacterium]|nr:TIGR00341 family protein [Anaerolineae bacterium]MCA9886932.1 TIGR00341 family protein [Anaerolineae bacterium]MCA9894878.1 TIGR00341 family protein [Anaerolineae bacterium]
MVTYAPKIRTYDALSALSNTQKILIPVASPDTAPALASLAQRMMSDTGGTIVLLHVIAVTDDSGPLIVPAFRSVIDYLNRTSANVSTEFVTRRADNVVDGILEVATELKVGMILLGLSYSVRGQVELGSVVETVARRAPCDVMVSRSPINATIDRIVVPVGGSIASQVILEMGVRLSHGMKRPMEAVHIFSTSNEDDAHEHVEKLLMTIPDSDNVIIKTVRGISIADTVLEETRETDLMIVGFSERNSIERWLYGNIPQRILDRALGPVLMVSRAIDNPHIQSRAQKRINWSRPILTDSEQDQIVWLAKDTVLPTMDYGVLLIVAAVLASLGLLMSSSAVIIGAMLVAPLMQPIISLAVGLCTARLRLMRQAMVTIGLSALAVIAIGILAGLVVQPSAVTQEMLARAYPSLLDAGVALAAGFIGAYATARKDIPAALAGVAIAAALVPPICTVGISLAIGEIRVAMGAGLLFITNLVSITIIGAVVFYWVGMRPTRIEDRSRRLRYAIILAGIAATFIGIGALLNVTHLPSLEKLSVDQLEAIFEPAEIVNLNIRQQRDSTLVVATVRTAAEISQETVKLAQLLVSNNLGENAHLRIIIQRVIEGVTDNTSEPQQFR